MTPAFDPEEIVLPLCRNRMNEVWREFNRLEKRLEYEGLLGKVSTDNLARLLEELEGSLPTA